MFYKQEKFIFYEKISVLEIIIPNRFISYKVIESIVNIVGLPKTT